MGIEVTQDDITKMLKAAALVKEKAYAPYSKFHVGAAVLSKCGKVFTGCNTENCAYGDTICAERSAILKAVSEGCTKFHAIAITSNLTDVITPCGTCRQVMVQFGSDWDVYMTRKDLTYVKKTVSELLPMAFKPSDVEPTKE